MSTTFSQEEQELIKNYELQRQKTLEELEQRRIERQIPDQWGWTWWDRHVFEVMTPGEISNDFRVNLNDYSTHVKKAKYVGRTLDGNEFIYDVTLADGTKTQVFYTRWKAPRNSNGDLTYPNTQDTTICRRAGNQYQTTEEMLDWFEELASRPQFRCETVEYPNGRIKVKWHLVERNNTHK